MLTLSIISVTPFRLVYLRFLHEHSDKNYFVISNPPVGKACETTALLVPSEDLAFKPLVDMLKVGIFTTIGRKTMKFVIKGAGEERRSDDHGEAHRRAHTE